MADDRKPAKPEEGAFVAADMFKDRTFERARGCWSCIHWNNDQLAKGKWTLNRQQDLARALQISLNDPRGEEAPLCMNIKAMVDTMDHGVALGVWGICLPGHSGTDFVHNAYLCDRWTGRQGASIATAGAKLDKLPEELKEDVGD
jgi:hypothetical protein